ncbi:tudor domain-containing 6 [Eucyclogobius newberryi]|uniref:tudor domain-containing 6 n=1 Tax=Eucyclogobius newberryi TaxID=166745 RepID=UPI003B5902A0
MRSVPGVPTPGSQVSVVVAGVNLNQNCGLVELWVNLNHNVKRVYEQMREEIQTPERRFCGTEGKTGDLCLANVDGKWHRARIVSVREENYDVFLIDQGRPRGTVSDKLAWGKDECFILPPEIECCVLANVLAVENDWPERATNFLKSLPGKEFHGLVLHALMPDRTILLDLPIVSKHLCKEGVAKKIPAGQFKNLVLKCLNLPEENATEVITKEQSLNASNQLENDNHYFYPELMTNALESVQVTEVIDPGNIFCELTIYSRAVQILTEQMNREICDGAIVDESQPQTIGMPCAAVGTDGKWRRAILKRQMTSKDATAEVFFVDEGKTELVPASHVRNLDRKFLRMPVATYKCKLEGVQNDRQWEQKEIDDLKSMILNQYILAMFGCHILPEERYSVSLYTSNAECINDYFLEKKAEEMKNDAQTCFPHEPIPNCATNGTANPSDFQNSERSSFIQSYNSSFSPMEMPLCDLLTVGASVGVKISCIDSINKFWCQTSQCNKKLDVLMRDLQAHYVSVHPKPLVESVCVARHPDNNFWYRVKIMTNQQCPDVKVRFIDFGQTKTVPLRELRPIDPTFLRLDAQAFQCSLVDVPLTDVNHANKEFRKFFDESLAQNRGLKCVVKAVGSDKEGALLNVVDLQTQSQSVSQVLSEKLATRPVVFNQSDHKILVNSKEKIRVRFSETVHNFYCQLDRNSRLFQQVQSDIEKLVPFAYSDHSFAINDLCIARYGDSKWQRGQVVELSPDLKVHFVDLGETLAINMTDIRPFPPEASSARTIPILAVPLALFNVPVEIPQEINAWFAEKVVGKCLTMSVLGKGPNGKLAVELFDELSKSLNGQVREKMDIAQADKRLCKGTSPVSNGTEEQTGDSDCDVAKRNVPHTSPTKQSEEVKIQDEPTLPSQNVLNHSTAQKMDDRTSTAAIDNEGKTPSPPPPSQTANLPEKKTYKKPIISFETQVLYASSITGPAFFWCQCSDTEELDKITELAQIEGKTEQDLFFPHFLPIGNPCLALYKTDNRWYRAHVVDKHQNTRDKLSVAFIDYGNEEDVDFKGVRPISPGLLAIAPQAFLCRLEVNDEELEAFEEVLDDAFYDAFHNVLVDKPLNVKVLRIGKNVKVKLPQYTVRIDSVDLHKLLDTYGITVGEIVPKNEICQMYRYSAFQNILYSKPNALLDKKLEAIVTFSSGPAHFWCQLSDLEKLDEINENAKNAGLARDSFLRNASFLKSLCPESPCLAFNSDDDKWYRAQIISKGMDTLKVVYVDYGKEKEISVNNVIQLPQRLTMMQPQAFLCRLERFDENAGELDDELYDRFYKAMADKLLEMIAVSVEHNEELKVPQYTIQIDASYAEKLDKQNEVKGATSASETSAEESIQTTTSEVPVNRCKFRRPQLDTDKTVVAYASCICEPDYFWCQFADRVPLNEIQELAINEGRAPHDMNFANSLVPGDPCIALFTEDRVWYRAQILSKMEDKFSVVFIDYGNEEDVMIQNIRPISQSLLNVAPQAFLCSLDGFTPFKGEWDEKVYDDLEVFLDGHLLKVTPFRKRFYGNNRLLQFDVDVHRGSTSVNEAMQKYWKENISTQDGRKLENLSTPESRKLKNPSTPKSSKSENSSTPKSSKSENSSTPKSSKSENSSTPKSSKSENPSTPKSSKSENSSTPKSSKSENSSTPKSSKSENSSTPESSKSENPSTPESSKSENPSTQLNENEQTDSNSSKQPFAYKSPNVSQNTTELAYASCIVDPHFFWCQFASWDEGLKTMAQEAGLSQPRPTTLNKGDPCLARFSEDNLWYRALVGEKKEEKFHVAFIDYGNEVDDVTIDDTRTLPQDLLDRRPGAFLCTLHGFEKSRGTWDDAVYDNFYNAILDKRLKVAIVAVEENAAWEMPRYSVRVELEEGTNVNALMEKYWKRSADENPKDNESDASRLL